MYRNARPPCRNLYESMNLTQPYETEVYTSLVLEVAHEWEHYQVFII